MIIQTCFGNGVFEGVEFNGRRTLSDLTGSRGTWFPEIVNLFSETYRNKFLVMLVTDLVMQNTLFAQIQRKNELLPHKRKLKYEILVKIGGTWLP